MTAPPEVIAAAREYFEQGYQVVAVKANKAPWGKNWRRAHNLDEVLKLLEEADCPAIGFLGGELNHGIVPIDFDTQEGDAWFCAQCELVGIDPFEFPMVVTPGKVGADGKRRQGFHRYVTDIRGTLGNATGPLLAAMGIDVRGRGHAMLPPSPHPDGGTYQWMLAHSLLTDFPNGVPPCPLFLYEAIEARYGPEGAAEMPPEAPAEPAQGNGADPGPEPQFRAPPPPQPSAGASGGQSRAEAYCRKALVETRDRLAAVTEGHRNAALNIEAVKLGHLAHFGVFGEGEALAALMWACDKNGLLADKVNGGTAKCHATFWSGWKKGLTEPWDFPPDPPRPGFGTSEAWKDYAGAGTKSDYSAKGAEYSGDKQEQQQRAEKPWTDLISDVDLYAREFPDLEWLVKDMLVAGTLNILAGRPKIGKSFLALQIGRAVAAGGFLWGKATAGVPVLYLGLEDTLRRLKYRMVGQLGAGIPPSGGVHFATLWPRIDNGGMAALKNTIARLGTKLVVIDTWARFRARAGMKRSGTAYVQDYDDLEPLIDFCRETGVAILLIHHTKKGDSANIFDLISGSVGLQGIVDCMMVLDGMPMGDDETIREAILNGTARDFESFSWTLEFEKVPGLWKWLGKTAAVRAKGEQEAIIDALGALGGAADAKTIAEHIDKSLAATRRMCQRMAKAGLLKSEAAGRRTLWSVKQNDNL